MTSDESTPVENEAHSKKNQKAEQGTSQSEAVENEALTRQIEAIEKEVAGVNKAMGQGRNIKRVIMLALVALILGICGAFYKMEEDFRSQENLDEMQRLVMEKYKDSSKSYMRELNKLMENSRPVLTDALKEQFEKDMPKLKSTINEQRDLLLENLKTRLTAQVKAHYQDMFKQHEAILKEELPQLDDQEQIDLMSGHLQLAFDKMLEKYYAEQIKTELETLFETWEDFPMAEEVAEGELSLEDQLVAEMFQLLAIKMAKRLESGAQPIGPEATTVTP